MPLQGLLKRTAPTSGQGTGQLLRSRGSSHQLYSRSSLIRHTRGKAPPQLLKDTGRQGESWVGNGPNGGLWGPLQIRSPVQSQLGSLHIKPQGPPVATPGARPCRNRPLWPTGCQKGESTEASHHHHPCPGSPTLLTFHSSDRFDHIRAVTGCRLIGIGGDDDGAGRRALPRGLSRAGWAAVGLSQPPCPPHGGPRGLDHSLGCAGPTGISPLPGSASWALLSVWPYSRSSDLSKTPHRAHLPSICAHPVPADPRPLSEQTPSKVWAGPTTFSACSWVCACRGVNPVLQKLSSFSLEMEAKIAFSERHRS